MQTFDQSLMGLLEAASSPTTRRCGRRPTATTSRCASAASPPPRTASGTTSKATSPHRRLHRNRPSLRRRRSEPTQHRPVRPRVGFRRRLRCRWFRLTPRRTARRRRGRRRLPDQVAQRSRPGASRSRRCGLQRRHRRLLQLERALRVVVRPAAPPAPSRAPPPAPEPPPDDDFQIKWVSRVLKDIVTKKAIDDDIKGRLTSPSRTTRLTSLRPVRTRKEAVAAK